MKLLIAIITIGLCFQSCKAQVNPNNDNMETFNIAEFESRNISGQYKQVLSDGTQIIQFGNSAEYVENTIPPNGWFYTHKEFYGNGRLKSKGLLFKKGDFKSGVWTTYDMQGVLLTQSDYDEPYNLTIDSVFLILKNEEIPFSIEDIYNTIGRGYKENRYAWIVTWKQLTGRLETVEIDDVSGKIMERNFIEFEEE